MSKSFERLEPQNILEILTRIYHRVQEEQTLESQEIIREMVMQLEALMS